MRCILIYLKVIDDLKDVCLIPLIKVVAVRRNGLAMKSY
jgi:hypothetical protein